MAWDECLAQNVTMVRETTDLLTARGAPSKFRYVPDGFIEKPGVQTRDYWYELAGGGMKGVMTIAPPRWIRARVDLCLPYQSLLDRATLQRLVMADHLALAGRLPDAAIWNQPTSTIESLYDIDGDGGAIVTFDIEKFDDVGLWLVRHHMHWEFRPESS
jgi:hypothetical protein